MPWDKGSGPPRHKGQEDPEQLREQINYRNYTGRESGRGKWDFGKCFCERAGDYYFYHAVTIDY